MAKELPTKQGGALTQIEQVRADAARAIAVAQELCRQMQETLAVLRAQRPRFQVRVRQLPNRESRN